MKKKIVLGISMMLTVSLMAGCKSNLSNENSSNNNNTQTETNVGQEEKENQNKTEQQMKTGFAVVTKLNDSKEAGNENGQAVANSLAAAVTLDEDGVITKCVIDAVQSKADFTKEGTLATDKNTVFSTKNELGETYGMKSASAIGKEWNEQAKAFADYVVGKTVEEVNGIAVKEGKAADDDLLASVTIHIGDFKTVVEKAVQNASNLGAKTGDRLGLAINTSMASSSDATKDQDGVVQIDSSYTVTTVDENGVITSCYIDGSQAKVGFDKKGTITTDIENEVLTKDELGETYGMKSASSIGKEWNEQAKAFADYVVGKTAEEVNGIAMKEGKAADNDLLASVTIHIGNFITDVVKSVESAE
ncbi:hypothetical protein [Velocimicrobium porci]|uniref:Uncharacterized protein n=1 Tax=Velocimicrobium porci TaxID=2606634 RepID=A0A6L5XVA5_9FIRM|nr:hypothetical protein [Velocimicrobium porci]MSS62318.1 hypothetical protein [Velocimicrobium porci]